MLHERPMGYLYEVGIQEAFAGPPIFWGSIRQ
jgi:hypothetical protein